jgi:hypothetical protein
MQKISRAKIVLVDGEWVITLSKEGVDYTAKTGRSLPLGQLIQKLDVQQGSSPDKVTLAGLSEELEQVK